jgi:hypothetical protein
MPDSWRGNDGSPSRSRWRILSSLVWEKHDAFRDGLRRIYPTVRLVEDCQVGWYRTVGFYHLLQRKQVSLSKARSATRGGVRGYSVGGKARTGQSGFDTHFLLAADGS